MQKIKLAISSIFIIRSGESLNYSLNLGSSVNDPPQAHSTVTFGL